MHPLYQFHTMLRSTAGAGYPNMSFFNPHPMEMSQYGMQRPRPAVSRYQGFRMPIQVSRPNPYNPVNSRQRPMMGGGGYKITR